MNMQSNELPLSYQISFLRTTGLVNNAGIFFAKLFTDFSLEDFETPSTVNLKDSST